jgi:hypothetical protein
MDKKIAEGLISENEYIFAFVGFDDWEDFDEIMKIIKEIVMPNRCDWGGMEDMHGFFDKNGLHVDVWFSSMIGNELVFKGDRTEANLAKVREWAQIIFDNLMLGDKET